MLYKKTWQRNTLGLGDDDNAGRYVTNYFPPFPQFPTRTTGDILTLMESEREARRLR